MKFKASIVKPGLWGLSKSDFREIGRKAIEECMYFWHTNYKQLHFLAEAFARYGYRPRSNYYEIKKLALYPESVGLPLVYTGESRADAMDNDNVDARATDFKHYIATATFNAPKLNFHASEMEAWAAIELETVAYVFEQEFEAGMVKTALDNGAGAGRVELWTTELNEAA